MPLLTTRSATRILPTCALLTLMFPAAGATAPQQTKEAVHGEGCVAAGVAPHCLVLRDLKTGHLYDLLFKTTSRPPVGLGIQFTGVPHSAPSACMQGTAVEVTAWVHKDSIQCTPGQAGKPGRTSAR